MIQKFILRVTRPTKERPRFPSDSCWQVTSPPPPITLFNLPGMYMRNRCPKIQANSVHCSTSFHRRSTSWTLENVSHHCLGLEYSDMDPPPHSEDSNHLPHGPPYYRTVMDNPGPSNQPHRAVGNIFDMA